MGERHIRRAVSAGGIAAIGVFTLAVHVVHALREGALHSLLLGAVVPMLVSLAVVGAGAWAYRSDFDDARLVRLGIWAVVGVLVGLLFGYPVIPYQNAHGVQMADVPFVLATWASTGAIGGFVVGYYDASQQRSQAMLERSRRKLLAREAELERENEQLETFAHLVSHDLRNPLNVAIGRIDAVRGTDDPDPDHLATVADALERMEAIISDLLTVARDGTTIDESDLEPVVLSRLATDCWETCATDGARLVVESDVRFRADPDRLRHVFENLFRNSVEHGSSAGADGGEADAVPSRSPDGGDRSSLTVRVGAIATEPGFYVEDDGPGIPPDERERVFDPEYSTDPNGTGLGLYLVSTIADAHDWDVAVTAGRDGGARFEITGVRGP